MPKPKISAALAARLAKLLPNNYPRYVRCYDNGGKTADRYTVVFTGRYNNIGRSKHMSRSEMPVEYHHVCMSASPFHPQGVGMAGSHTQQIDLDEKHHRWAPGFGKSNHLGKRIHWHELPEDCKKLALRHYKDLWRLDPENQ